MTLTTLQLSESGRTVAQRSAGQGEPLVLIHGVGMQSAAWAPQIAAFSDTHRVIAVDMPGHGGSDPLPHDSRLPDFVAWCGDVLETLGCGPVNLAGHSMGALIAGGMAATQPQLVRRVALLNGVYRRSETARQAVLDRAGDIRNGRMDLETPLARWFGPSPAEAAAKSKVAHWLGTVETDGYAAAYEAFANGDATFAAAFGQIACPFLAITGEDDPNSTPEMARQMASQVPGGTSAVIAGHRHMINLTAPLEVNAHLAEWLARAVHPEAIT